MAWSGDAAPGGCGVGGRRRPLRGCDRAPWREVRQMPVRRSSGVRVSEARETTTRVEPRRTLPTTNDRPSGQAHDAALAASPRSSGSAVQDAPRNGPSATRSAAVAASPTATKATSRSPAIPAHWPGPASSSRTEPAPSPRTASMSAPARRSQTTSARAGGAGTGVGSGVGSGPGTSGSASKVTSTR